MTARHLLRIGQLATQVNINPKTIRYYEQIGLLPAAQRSKTGYRLYTDADHERLSFIVKARQLGLTLEDIHTILTVREQGTLPCDQVIALLDQKLVAVEEQIRALTQFREELRQLRAVAGQESVCAGAVCGIIESYEHP